jgi:transposase
VLKAEQQAQVSQTEELRRLKAELRRVTEEREILKNCSYQASCANRTRSKTLYGTQS